MRGGKEMHLLTGKHSRRLNEAHLKLLCDRRKPRSSLVCRWCDHWVRLSEGSPGVELWAVMELLFSLPSFFTALRNLKWKQSKWAVPCFVHQKGSVYICLKLVINEKSPDLAVKKCVLILTFPPTASFHNCKKKKKNHTRMCIYKIICHVFLSKAIFVFEHLIF